MRMGEIILLTGEFQSGKTNLCLDLYKLAQETNIRVGGVISPAVFEGDKKIAIDALDLKSGIRNRLAELRTSQQSDLETQRWSFFSDVVTWGNKMLEAAVPCDLLLIDELGPLEFQRGKGWLAGFSAIESGDYSTALIVIRPSLVVEAARRWKVSRTIDLDRTTLDSSMIKELIDGLDPA